MATTDQGQEFYLVQVTPLEESTKLEAVLEVMTKVLRSGDGVFSWKDNVYVAIVGDIPGVGKAVRRMIKLAKEQGLETRIRLITEPFPQELQSAATQVISGQVRVHKRAYKGHTPGDIRVDWEG